MKRLSHDRRSHLPFHHEECLLSKKLWTTTLERLMSNVTFIFPQFSPKVLGLKHSINWPTLHGIHGKIRHIDPLKPLEELYTYRNRLITCHEGEQTPGSWFSGGRESVVKGRSSIIWILILTYFYLHLNFKHAHIGTYIKSKFKSHIKDAFGAWKLWRFVQEGSF